MRFMNSHLHDVGSAHMNVDARKIPESHSDHISWLIFLVKSRPLVTMEDHSSDIKFTDNDIHRARVALQFLI